MAYIRRVWVMKRAALMIDHNNGSFATNGSIVTAVLFILTALRYE